MHYNSQSSSRGRPAVEKRSECFRSSACARVHVYVMRVRQAATRARPLALARACVRTCAYVRLRESACVGASCRTPSAARDASIARKHLERRRVFCSRTFRMLPQRAIHMDRYTHAQSHRTHMLNHTELAHAQSHRTHTSREPWTNSTSSIAHPLEQNAQEAESYTHGQVHTCSIAQNSHKQRAMHQ